MRLWLGHGPEAFYVLTWREGMRHLWSAWAVWSGLRAWLRRQREEARREARARELEAAAAAAWRAEVLDEEEAFFLARDAGL